MKTAEIREKFIQFFQQKAHTHVASSSLLPAADPTLLFINSGMAQFKDVFLGFEKRPYDKAVTAQRCLRAGGKHNDLENVGYTNRHHTFFEMLGNFSFGDYFKEKAIPYAWEFLTSPAWLNLDKKHLWVTVFGGGNLFGGDSAAVPADDEAAAIWLKTLMAAGFNEDEAKHRISRIPTTDNFWMMGDTGPCGPCSEIFYDKDADATRFRGEDEECGDICVEVWNLVFMQYNRDDDGVLHALPAPCVDTGMGLERISAVMQGVEGNYDIDLFADLLVAVTEVAGVTGKPLTPSHCVIADHIRSAAYLIADGVLPSNEGRGYVLRRIIRRALRHLHKICDSGEPRFYLLVPVLARLMGEFHPLLGEKQDLIAAQLKSEESAFATLLKNGMTVLDAKIRSGGGKLSGAIAFKLYDTYGFPFDMTVNIARDDYGVEVDEQEFERCMEQQRARSRAAMKFNIGQKTAFYEGEATTFTGYEQLRGEAEVLALFVNGENVKEARPNDDAMIILNRTPFYAESGGQIGDSGGIRTGGGGAMTVCDTQKIRADVWGHFGEVSVDSLRVGDKVECVVDRERRENIARNHSAAHLMHAALRQVLGKHVEQRGSMVSDKAVRFDFSHNAAMTADEMKEVESIVNQQIRANAAVATQVMDYDDALKTGAMALFGEKYGARVRVVTIDEKFSVELCGGTHVRRGGDIGLFQFIGESAIAAGIRRVEAVTADMAVVRVQQLNDRLATMATMLKTPAARIEEKITQLRESLKAAQKQMEELQAVQTAAAVAELAAQAKNVNGVNCLICRIAAADGKKLRDMAMQLRSRVPAPAAILLAGDKDGGAAFVAAVAGVDGGDAKTWMQQATAVAGAKGGGKKDFAQAGGGEADKIDDALRAAEEWLRSLRD